MPDAIKRKTHYGRRSPAAIAMIMRKRARYALVSVEAGVEQCVKTHIKYAQKNKIEELKNTKC